MIEAGGEDAETENDGWKNVREFKSLSTRDGLNGDCFEEQSIKSQALVQLPGCLLRS